METLFKDIPGFENEYQATSDGRMMTLYVLHNIKPHALELAEEPEKEEDDEPSLGLDDLLRFLRS